MIIFPKWKSLLGVFFLDLLRDRKGEHTASPTSKLTYLFPFFISWANKTCYIPAHAFSLIFRPFWPRLTCLELLYPRLNFSELPSEVFIRVSTLLNKGAVNDPDGTVEGRGSRRARLGSILSPDCLDPVQDKYQDTNYRDGCSNASPHRKVKRSKEREDVDFLFRLFD